MAYGREDLVLAGALHAGPGAGQLTHDALLTA